MLVFRPQNKCTLLLTLPSLSPHAACPCVAVCNSPGARWEERPTAEGPVESVSPTAVRADPWFASPLLPGSFILLFAGEQGDPNFLRRFRRGEREI